MSLTHDLALYALSTLLALELRGAVLCDVGPSNLMVRAPIPYPPDDLRGRGWVERPPQDPPPRCGELRECVSKFPSDPDRISSGSVRSQATGLEG